MCAGAGTSVSSRLPVNSSNHPGRSRKRSLESRLLSLFLFWFWEVVRCQFPGAVPSLRSSAGLDEDKSCDVDFEDELLPELTDSPGTTRGTTYMCASSLVCTSPLAVSTTVGFLDLRKVSSSSELKCFFLLSMFVLLVILKWAPSLPSLLASLGK